MSMPAAASGSRPTGGQNRVTSAHIVRNDESAVAFAVREGFQRPAAAVRDGDDAPGRLLTSVAAFDFAADQPEGNGRLGRGARLGDHDGRDRPVLDGCEQTGQIVFRQVLSDESRMGFAGCSYSRLNGSLNAS